MLNKNVIYNTVEKNDKKMLFRSLYMYHKELSGSGAEATNLYV